MSDSTLSRVEAVVQATAAPTACVDPASYSWCSTRQKVRGLLREIIAYGEMLLEQAQAQALLREAEELQRLHSEAQSILIFTSVLAPAATVNFELQFNRLRQELMHSAKKMMTVVESIATSDAFRSGNPDFARVREAVQALIDLGETGIAKISSVSFDETITQRPNPLHSPVRTIDTSAAPARRGVLLVVDDDAMNRDILNRRLTREGFEVVLANNGPQALELANKREIDLVLLDIVMPEMSGIEVLQSFKSDPQLRHTPVIMISAVDEVQSVVKCIEMGADDFLPKPFNPVLLRARIGAQFDRKRLRDEERKKSAELQRAFETLDKERHVAESLLRNILPESVAAELRIKGNVSPMYFQDATIVFTDFVGFTLSTEQLSAEQLVETLHEYFTQFDRITSRYGLEKLKTIGDSYMFAGGIPTRSTSHPVDAVLACFELVRAAQEIAQRGDRAKWQVRVGVHTGPAVAGVVGIHKFAFDIWGDSVNFASRMEASGEPDRINISASTYARVKDFFACDSRGKIKIKDGRRVDMYFVNGVTSDLLVEDALTPTTPFARRYRTYFQKDLVTCPDWLYRREEKAA